MQTLETLQNHYTSLLHEEVLRMGKKTHRKHAHMHTLDQPGIDVNRVDKLVQNYLWVQSDRSLQVSDNDLAGLKSISLDEIDAKFDKLATQISAAEDGDGLLETVSIEDVYNLDDLDNIWKGQVSMTVDEELHVGKDQGNSSEKWDSKSLMQSLSL
ncbi:hypothetical protein C0992_010820 [Termitomyces sp. T32_za158]|nr:hypothetical protein C0992_010820 [Termitomyces sp. T32_za158]